MLPLRHLRIARFRSIEHASLPNCSGLNVLIGRNNAGKSNILSAIELSLRHLSSGQIITFTEQIRFEELHLDKATHVPFEIDISLAIDHDSLSILQDALRVELAYLDNSIAQLSDSDTLLISLRGIVYQDSSLTYVAEIGLTKMPASAAPVPIFRATYAAAIQLAKAYLAAQQLDNDGRQLTALTQTYGFRELFRSESRRLPTARFPARVVSLAETAARDAVNQEQAIENIEKLQVDMRQKASQLRSAEVDAGLRGYGGDVKSIPQYVTGLLERLSSLPVLHLRENRDPIGAAEAQTLLQLKVQRGGREKLAQIQQTVEALLGVQVDAFQTKGPGGDAEMDVDNFLVQANGSGIRESLRLILDLELRSPRVLLLEEPEAHLHPGLAYSVLQYLRSKASDVQIFVTTHSTSFVDTGALPNVYLVARDSNRRTIVQPLATDAMASRIPAELGLRLSTVFMYDRLVFVEGPSDEAALRECARTLELDLSQANVGFVQLGGVGNFAHYAAEGTLDILSRRSISMWFVVDRDERSDADVKAMLQRLGDRAKLIVLNVRDLETTLLCPRAIAQFLKAKGKSALEAEEDAVATVLKEVVEASKDDVIRLHVEDAALPPIRLRSRGITGSPAERLEAAQKEIGKRLSALSTIENSVRKDVESRWAGGARSLVQGATTLDKVMQRFGHRFAKDAGDTARLAALLRRDEISPQIVSLLKEICAR